MKEKLEKLLGKSWRTTLCGALGVLLFTVHESPSLIEFLPDQIESTVLSVTKLAVAVLIALGFGYSKDYNVTGTKDSIPKAIPVPEEPIVNTLTPKKPRAKKKANTIKRKS
jgi:hypothetical protein